MNGRSWRLIVVLVLLALALVFTLQNAASVEVRLLFWGVTLPRSALIFVVLAVGAVIGWFLRGFMRRSGGRAP